MMKPLRSSLPWLTSAVLLSLVIPTAVLAQCVSPPASADPTERFFWFDDFQYFRPPQAAIRTPAIYAQLMPTADSVPMHGYSSTKNPFNGKKGRAHAEAGFGGNVPVVSWTNRNEGCTSGIDFYLHSSVHTLLRLSDQDLVNSDFGFGGGIRFRGGGPSKRVSGRLIWKHESTHLGDEYTFKAASTGDFRRYNVGVETLELQLGLDNAPEFIDVGWYTRAYAGTRWHTGKEGNVLGFDYAAEGHTLPSGGGSEPVEIDPLRYRHRWDFNAGAEWWSPLLGRGGRNARFFLAGELYWRDRLDVTDPERVKSWSAGFGWLWGGEGFGQSEMELSARFYGGIHPHGQFRSMEGFRYWAVRLGFNP
jgi:hypothetical protein